MWLIQVNRGRVNTSFMHIWRVLETTDAFLQCFRVMRTQNNETQSKSNNWNRLYNWSADWTKRNRTRRHFSELKLTLKAHDPANFTQACKLVISNHSEIYPDFAVLAHICITLPISSVPCERGFSYQNLVKTANRSRMTNTGNLMRIVIDNPGPDQSMDLINKARIEFDKRCKHRKWLVSEYVCTRACICCSCFCPKWYLDL